MQLSDSAGQELSGRLVNAAARDAQTGRELGAGTPKRRHFSLARFLVLISFSAWKLIWMSDSPQCGC